MLTTDLISGDVFDILYDFATDVEKQGKEGWDPRAANVADSECAVGKSDGPDATDEDIAP